MIVLKKIASLKTSASYDTAMSDPEIPRFPIYRLVGGHVVALIFQIQSV